MEFRVLGPLEALDGGRSVPLRGEKQRALLAALLIRANEVVPEDVLLHELWGGTPPGSGKAALRVRVSQLRRTLGEGGARLVTRAPGYVLEAADAELDARRFEALLAEGREARLGGDAARAVETLHAALALWRGPPLADVAYEAFAQAEIARLRELRLAAVEELTEAELALGRHVAITPELEALVAEHPLRERLRGQLMTALYRSGRQAEALAAYRAGRERLVEELGIEPGVALQELERAILRQDPRLDLPGTEPIPGAAPVRDELKLVTVLALRIAAPSAPDPERARELLDRLHAIAEAEVEAAGGRIEAVVGETITAAFGVPSTREDHAVRALHAALATRDRAGDAVRMGLESGDAIVAPGGRGSSVVGAVVSGATRLAEAAEPGAILVGPRLATMVERSCELGPPREDGSRAVQAGGRSRGADRRAALVGRRREIAALAAAYRACADEGRPHLVTVAGDAGVGKTRLVEALRDLLANEAPVARIRVARCLPYGRGGAYEPLADVLREELGVVEHDRHEEVLARLGEDQVLGLTLGLDVLPDLHPLAAREQLERAWTGFLGRRTEDGPVVLVLEDLHWAHDPLLDLVRRLRREASGPLLVVGTARPELVATHPAWGRDPGAATIWLEPLRRADAERLLELAGGGSVPPVLRGEVLDRAEGNPFFLEELVRAAPFTTRIPDSVQGVLAGRIDLLPTAEKAALQAAAVIGRAFWRGPVLELLGGASPDLSVLEARDFVRRSPASTLEGEDEFTFKHALTWEVAYGTLTTADRARLHAVFARWLERTGGGRDEHASLLAHHYASAVRPGDDDGEVGERAIHWLRRAAELAVRRYELDDAVALLERAVELSPEEATELDLRRRIARAHALRHDGDAFLEASMAAIALAPDRATCAELYADLSLETALRTGMWRRRPERELVDGWIDRALELAAPESATRARALVARCVWAPHGSQEEAREASRIAARLGDAELRSYAWDARAITMWVSGERDLGRAFEERRFELLDEIHDPDHVADIHYAPVTGCVWLGYFTEARRLAAIHDAIVDGLTPHHRIHGLAVLTELEELVGGWRAIRALGPRLEPVVLRNRETPCMRSPRILLVSALAELRLGDPGRAAELETLADEFGVEGFGHTLDTPRIRLALVRGELDIVERLVAEPLPDRGWHRAWLLLSTESARLDALAALGRRADLEAWPAPRRGTYLEPFLLRALGRVREDEALLARAADAFARLGLDGHVDG